MRCNHAVLTNSSSSRSESLNIYLLLGVLDLLLEPLVLQLGLLVLSLQLIAVHLTTSAQHPLEVVNRIAWLLWLLVELDEDLGELVDCAGLLQIFFELLLLGLDSALGYQRITWDIAFKNKFY